MFTNGIHLFVVPVTKEKLLYNFILKILLKNFK